ncbi:DUF3017 domain-containing protein [Demequina sp. NBRC 110057]|uniref:DUF3017 domain-containing protein n=1 Tax=Demequina sp. NBRC 110057 TaxID=1570346 RepID=UPI000A05A38A|nr:DUF3017 domain-containing protein [Demequina sp. NBRC 110057]
MADEHEDTEPGVEEIRAQDNTTQASLATAAIALGVVAVCVLVGALVDAQAGTLMLAGSAFGGAAVRTALPAGVSFSVRRRAIDVTLMIGFGIALAVLGLTVPLD